MKPVDHVFLTAGLSELPVLITAFRLCALNHEKGRHLPEFTVICSGDNALEVRRVHKLLTERLRQEAWIIHDDELVWEPLPVDPSRPKAVREAVRGRLSELSRKPHSEKLHYHLNYTGGKSSMGPEALWVLLEERGSPHKYVLTTSYLDADKHRLADDEMVDLSGSVDERSAWNLELKTIARLHGYESDTGKNPSEALMDLSADLTARFLANDNAIDDYKKKVIGQNMDWIHPKGWKWGARWPALPDKEYAPPHPFRWPYPDFYHRLKALFCPGAWEDSNQSVDWRVLRSNGPVLAEFHQFLQHQWFELVVYRALRSALAQEYPTLCARLYHSAICWRTGMPKATTKFEVDVLAVLGHQLLGISATVSDNPNVIKEKTHELLGRLRNIGGTAARPIIVCRPGKWSIGDVMENLHDDLGGRHAHVTILTFTNEAALVGDLIKYFKDDKKRTGQGITS